MATWSEIISETLDTMFPPPKSNKTKYHSNNSGGKHSVSAREEMAYRKARIEEIAKINKANEKAIADALKQDGKL